MNELKKHPGWKDAIDKILKRFEEGGYGIIITDEEVNSYLSLKKPEGQLSYDEFKQFDLERMQIYKSLEILLEEHNICLIRSKSTHGFELLPPKDQIKIAFDKRMTKVRRELNKAQMAIVNIDHTLLSITDEADRQRKLTKTAFIRCAINKRKFEIVAPKEQKQIAEAK